MRHNNALVAYQSLLQSTYLQASWLLASSQTRGDVLAAFRVERRKAEIGSAAIGSKHL